MHNVTYEIKANKLIIMCDVSPKVISDAPPSASGKTKLVGSTSGSVGLAIPGLSFSLNLMQK